MSEYTINPPARHKGLFERYEIDAFLGCIRPVGTAPAHRGFRGSIAQASFLYNWAHRGAHLGTEMVRRDVRARHLGRPHYPQKYAGGHPC